MKNLHIQYKMDTGKSPVSQLIESIELRGAQMVFVNDFPAECMEPDGVIIPNPEYLEWLEEKLEELQKQTV